MGELWLAVKQNGNSLTNLVVPSVIAPSVTAYPGVRSLSLLTASCILFRTEIRAPRRARSSICLGKVLKIKTTLSPSMTTYALMNPPDALLVLIQDRCLWRRVDLQDQRCLMS